MADSTNFSFSTLEKVIEKHGTKRTNELLCQLLLIKKLDVFSDQPIVKTIIMAVCEEYNISPNDLIHSSQRGTVQDAKRLLSAVFHFELGFSARSISTYIFKREYHLFVQKGIKKHKQFIISKSSEYYKRYNRVIDKINSLTNFKKINDEND